jgi:outer membrane protein TolC
VIGAVATIGSGNLGGVNRSMSVYRVIAAMSLAASVAACTVGPDFVDPEMRVPAAFAFLAPARPSKTGVDPVQAQRIGSWWKTLHDAELNSLVERAVAANPDIDAALDRVQQAREREIAVLGAALPRVGAGGSVALGSGTDSVKSPRIPPTLDAGINTTGFQEVTGGRWLRRRVGT